MTDLERSLVLLGRELDVPPTPDLAGCVRGELASATHGSRPRPRPTIVVVLAALVVAALLATLAIPDARSALLRFLQVGGAHIELVDELPPVPQTPPELQLTLGAQVSLEDARRRATFPLFELDEDPDEVYIGERGTIWFLYGQPERVRLLVAQTPTLQIDEPFFLKKLSSAGTRVEPFEVRGESAFLLSGAQHVVMLLDEDGEAYPESARLARDVVLWEEAGRTIRLEGELTRNDAIALAEELRVRSPG
jgi:hypothetical protein